jgi:hypothetical protein
LLGFGSVVFEVFAEALEFGVVEAFADEEGHGND